MRVTLEPPNTSMAMGTALERPDFSLVLGGPLFQLFRRAHLSGASLEMLHRRVLFMPLLAWLPLLLLSVFERHALGGAIKIPFLHDIESSVRFLVALPVLIASEMVVHDRISPLIRRFVEKHIVVTEDLPAFYSAVRSALRVRDSLSGELILAILVYTAGLWIWRSQVALGDPTWYALPDTKRLHLTLAGYWYAFVSIPMFQFILLRWYMRLVIWFRLLWKISRLTLHLSAAHPDRAGGLGFIGKSSYAFGPILFAEGVLLSGVIASRVLYEGTALLSFKMQAAGFIGFFVVIILGPLLMFAPLLERTQRRGSREYSLLANQCVFRFEEKWIRGRVPDPDDVLGSEDIQTMASMADIFSVVRQMRYVPFGTQDITYLAAIAAAPLLPLALTIFSVPELAKLLIKVLFH
jgi:hypothetical protein